MLNDLLELPLNELSALQLAGWKDVVTPDTMCLLGIY